jgi:hypothetical protein
VSSVSGEGKGGRDIRHKVIYRSRRVSPMGVVRVAAVVQFSFAAVIDSAGLCGGVPLSASVVELCGLLSWSAACLGLIGGTAVAPPNQ